jgi:hypothetical protein
VSDRLGLAEEQSNHPTCAIRKIEQMTEKILRWKLNAGRFADFFNLSWLFVRGIS